MTINGIVRTAVLSALTCLNCGAAFDIEDLASGFREPPSDARPWVYWVVMDGNQTRAGITADLEAMQRAGIGGAILMEVDIGVPRGTVRFMSDEWRANFKHLVAEAARLDLKLNLITSPGWTGSGGPWIKPEQSMQHLVSSATQVHGPARFDDVLPQPQPREPFFGLRGVPESLKQAWREFYRDEAVLAFPTPRNPAGIPDLDEKALYFRAPYSSQPGVKPYLPAPADFPPSGADRCVARKQIVNLTDRMTPEGRLAWNVPEGDWTILRFGRTSTGQNTRPAPLPGLGFECDKFDSAALDAHLDAYLAVLLADVAPYVGRSLVSIHFDSWEMSSQNWTAAFRDEFRCRRGYDPLEYLPILAGVVVDSPEISERFLWDLRQTAQELVIRNHAERLREFAHEHGLLFSVEPYDMNPCADLALGAAADVPMCEFWSWGFGFNTEYSVFEAVSLAHLYDRPVVGAEAFTSLGTERWLQYPGRMKSQGDWAFCSGVNRFVFHRYQHQPALEQFPGMTMGPFGVHWERTQTWWEMAGAYHEYLARCQFVLQQGTPVVDVLYLTPEGAPQVFQPPASALTGEHADRSGYNFDSCAPDTLVQRVSVTDRKLTLPTGASYEVLILPDFETMTPALLRKITELVRAGATVIGNPPRKSPSLAGYPQCDAEVRRLAAELWRLEGDEPPGAPQRFGLGRMIRPARTDDNAAAASVLPDIYPGYEFVAGVLAADGVPPDFESDAPLRYTHRRLRGLNVYFVANPADEVVTATAVFRVAGKRPELWQPLNGERRNLPQFTESAGRISVPLCFDPHESYFVLFRDAADSGETRAAGSNFPTYETLADIAVPWQVRFQEDRGAPEQIRLDELLDLSRHPEPGVRYFSGVAEYHAKFKFSAPAPADPAARLYLDLGRVAVMANVRLNDQDLGMVWTPPYRVDATDILRPGVNTLDIRVANLWPNRLIGDAGEQPDHRVAQTNWNPFSTDDALPASGLLGPVTVQAQVQASTGQEPARQSGR